MHTSSPTAAKATAGPAAALATGLPIGFLAGLIGLGGGEFRLPVLVSLFAIAARTAVPLNLVVSMITLLGAFAVRGVTLSLSPIAQMAPAVAGLTVGSMAGAYSAPGLLRRMSDHQLERLLALLLITIAVILLVEAFVPLVPLGLLAPTGAGGFLAGAALGIGVGIVASALGVAGGELLIPTLILVYGAAAAAAGTASLAISMPTVLSGLVRYGRLGMLPDRATLRRIGLPMGVGSLIGAALGGVLVPFAPDALLKGVLGIVLIAAALKTFAPHRRPA